MRVRIGQLHQYLKKKKPSKTTLRSYVSVQNVNL